MSHLKTEDTRVSGFSSQIPLLTSQKPESNLAQQRDMGSGGVSERVKKILKENLLIIMMVLAVIIGVSLGIGLRSAWDPWDARKIFYLRFPGDLLMNMLKMLILPLIVSSLITAMGGLDAKASGKMGLRTVVYYMTTTFAAVVLGIILVLSIQPGHKGDKDITKSGTPKKAEALDALFDLIRNCFPDNLIEAAFKKQVTEIKNKTVELGSVKNSTNTSTGIVNITVPAQKFVVDDPTVTKSDGMNILGIVVFSLFLGAVLSRMRKEGEPLVKFFDCLHIATMKLVTLVIWYSPFGIVFLIAAKLVEMEDPESMFKQLAYYMVTVLAGLGIHAFIVLPLVYFIFTRKNPFRFMYGMVKAVLTAWGTASSSATLPLTMKCLEENNGVDPRVTMFVTPIGATINMDGTALYEAVASIFIAQYIGEDLSIGEVIVVSLTATAAAIGAAGVPQAGLVTMTIVLTAVGLPIDEITLILSIDWFLDRFRTAVNVLGDAYGAGIVEHLSRNDIENMGDKDVALDQIEVKVEKSNGKTVPYLNNHSVGDEKYDTPM